MAFKFKKRALSLHVQGAWLRNFFPESNLSVRNQVLIWEGNLVPSPLSEKYTVKIMYKLGKRPKIFVLNPELVVPEGEKSLPHTYGEKGGLCLYHPPSGEWDETMRLTETIVPWISEWLLHYEIWLATGEWKGEGIHPPRKKIINAATTK